MATDRTHPTDASVTSAPVTRANAARRRYARTFAIVTVASAVTTWAGLTVAAAIAAERCRADGLGWSARTWRCTFPGGTITLPQGLRRSH
jgi:hypothetical protein